MHLGFSLCTTQPALSQTPAARAIIAFGDSLTEGAGASAPDHAFPAQAAALFDPPRRIANRGVGGQTSTQIAARQGAVSLLLGLASADPKNLYPHTRDWMDIFESGAVNGVTHECVGAGIDETGQPYGDVRIYGTATGTFTDIGRQVYGAIAANLAIAAGTAWTISGDIQVIAGSTDGVAGFRLLLIEADEFGGYLSEIAAPAFALDGTRSRVVATATASHPYIRSTHLLDLVAGSAVDITLRIFPGQFENGSLATTLQLTPGDGEIPAYHPESSTTYPFSSDAQTWSARSQDGHPTPVVVQDGKLIVENDDAGILRGCELATATIAGGKIIHIGFDIEISGSGQIQVGGLQTAGGSWATTAQDGEPSWAISQSGHYELVLTSGNVATASPSCGAIAFLSSGTLVSWALDNVLVEWGEQSPQVSVASRSIDILTPADAAGSSLTGTLAGAGGILTTGADGQWRFTRSREGDALPVPYRTPFVPADAASTDIQWLLAGRNNADAPDIVLADIAAMAEHAPGRRSLVGAILPSADDSLPVRENIRAINAALAARYQQRYVDLLAALVASAGETTEDQQDAEAGLVPRSLRSDALHLNDRGYAIVAAAWVAATTSMRW